MTTKTDYTTCYAEIFLAAPSLGDYVETLANQATESYYTRTKAGDYVLVEDQGSGNWAIPAEKFMEVVVVTAHTWHDLKEKAANAGAPLDTFLDDAPDAKFFQVLCDHSHSDAWTLDGCEGTLGAVYAQMCEEGLSGDLKSEILGHLSTGATAIVRLHEDLAGPNAEPVDNEDCLEKFLVNLEGQCAEDLDLSTDPNDYTVRGDQLVADSWDPSEHPTPRPGVDAIATVLLGWQGVTPEETTAASAILEGFALALQGGKLEFCDWILDYLDCDSMPVVEILAVLTATLPAKDHLPNRKDFFSQAKLTVRHVCPDNWERQLKGLQ